MLLEFTGQSVQDSGNKAINTGRLINCYRESVVGAGKSQYVLQSVLGQALTDDIGSYPIRAMGSGNDLNFLAGNSRLYGLASDGTVTNHAAIADDAETVISGNYSDVTITAGNNYYVWDGSSISQPTTKTFTNVKSHFYCGGYTVLLEDGGKRFQWSAIGDATTLTASHFSSADKVDDDLVRGFEIQGAALLMCETSSELWQITGEAGTTAFAFVSSWNNGLRAANLATKFDDSLFWVSDDDNVYIGVGPGAVDITTPAINTSLTDNDPTHVFYYEDRGHKFCVIRFSDRPAWVYDVKMQEWHERAEGADDGPWRATASIEGDTWQVGNSIGEIYSLARTNKDLNGVLRRTAISSPVYTGDKFTVDMFEANVKVGENMLNEAVDFGLEVGGGFMLYVESGFGLEVDSTDGSERDGTITLCTSRDGGRTWDGMRSRSLGLGGDYEKRTVWNNLGQFQQAAVKLTIGEPADFQINTTCSVKIS